MLAAPILAAMKAGMTWEEAVDFTAIQRADTSTDVLRYCPACEPAPEKWYHKECVPDNQLWKPAETTNVCTAGGLHGSESVSICRCGHKVS